MTRPFGPLLKMKGPFTLLEPSLRSKEGVTKGPRPG